jgi:hypothetical protein
MMQPSTHEQLHFRVLLQYPSIFNWKNVERKKKGERLMYAYFLLLRYQSNKTLCCLNRIYLLFNEREIVITPRQFTDF